MHCYAVKFSVMPTSSDSAELDAYGKQCFLLFTDAVSGVPAVLVALGSAALVESGEAVASELLFSR